MKNDAYEKSLKKSINKTVPINYQAKKKKLPLKYVERRAFVAFVALAIATITVVGVNKTINKIELYQDIKEVQQQEITRIDNILWDYNLSIIPNSEHQTDNNYSVIDNLSEEDLYGFVNTVGVKETEKIVKILGYQDFNNFLIMNGYYDSDGKPSLEVWKNYEEARLLDLKKGMDK